MKNNKIKLYAKALVAASLKPGVDVEKIKNNFLKLLQKNGDMSRAKEILAQAEDLFIKKTGRRKVVLETARRMKAKQREVLESALQKGDIIEEKINKELLAGVKIIINDEQLDMSMQSKLQKLF